MDNPSTQPDPETSPQPEEDKPKAKAKKEIHVVSIPHENDMIADEMAELFEEDQVTHKHGSAEPEGD